MAISAPGGEAPDAIPGAATRALDDVTSAQPPEPELPEFGSRGATRTAGGGATFARWREILYMLVLRDLKARSKQAYLGYLWILIQPLLVTGVFSVLVQQVLGRGDLSDVPYPVFLMA